MTGRAVILDQKGRARLVVLFEFANECDGGAVEGVDILVVIADGKEAEFQVVIIKRAPRNGSDEC